MQTDEEYELLPHEELEQLRREVAAIKKNPIHGTRQAAYLQNSVDELTSAINKLITLFSSTNDQLTHDFRRTSVTEHFSLISQQNEQIAQGILTLADMMPTKSEPLVTNVPPVNEASVPPSSELLDSSNSSLPPFDQAPPSSSQDALPPLGDSSFNLPPPTHNKRGLFGK